MSRAVEPPGQEGARRQLSNNIKLVALENLLNLERLLSLRKLCFVIGRNGSFLGLVYFGGLVSLVRAGPGRVHACVLGFFPLFGG